MPIDRLPFATMEAAARTLADRLCACLQEAVSARGQALLAVSGGRTPGRVFEHLRARRLDWQRVTITLVDERWVAPDHPDSNQALVMNHLLQGAAAAARFVPLYGGEDTPQEGREACEERLQQLDLPFDAVYLGMGEDGHFASLFPGEPAIDVREGRCVAVPSRGARLARMSLTAPTILDARRIFLFFSGAAKYVKFNEACRQGPASEVPLRLVLGQGTVPVSVLHAP